jgi:ATP-dependent RNA helicase DeaD
LTQPNAGISEPEKRRRRRGGRRRNHTSASSGPAEEAPSQTPGDRATRRELPLPAAFEALGVHAAGLQAIAELGFTVPTPIQERALPYLVEGRDVVGLAQTGSGKTLAFALPLSASIDPASRQVQSIILVPTRELGSQVLEVLQHLARLHGFRAAGLFGGRKIAGDFRALEDGAQVVVGTPGRVIDHLERKTLTLSAVHFVVLDEADQMFDIGFARDIDYILRHCPTERQTALFSATMPTAIRRLVYSYMHEPVNLSVDPEQRPAEAVRQLYCEIAERDKLNAFCHFYENMDLGRSLVFRRTRQGVERLTVALQDRGIPARAIHGELRQTERDRVMRDFRNGDLQILIATNVAARGLDIKDIAHVVNYDVPQNAEEYIHRVGRTGRAGKEGSAITFVGEWELVDWERITGEIGDIELEELEYRPAPRTPRRRREPVTA